MSTISFKEKAALTPRLGCTCWKLVEISEPGIAPSQSVYVIFDNMAPDMQTEAVAFLEESLSSSCPADVDGDDSVGFADVLTVLADWGCGIVPCQ